MAKVTFLGTGLMGSALAEAAAKRGDVVVAWNRSIEKARALEAFGVKVASDVASAIADAERVHVMLSDDASVDAVLESAGGALDGKLVIDHTTALPKGTLARAERLEARGVRFLHAPVFMSPAMCRSAGGIMLAAGPRALFDAAEGELRKMSGSLEYLGERRDLAAAYKLFGNAMIITVTAGLADVFGLAASLNVPAEDALGLFSKFNPAGTFAYRGVKMAAGDFAPSFELTMARKDTRLMIETAARGDKKLGVLPAIAAWMDALIARGHGAEDLGVLAVDAVPPKAKA
jgi:3-hydroxyisobutyrate dehydrogenase-like beta-hydroxyacid dehydrogenase